MSTLVASGARVAPAEGIDRVELALLNGGPKLASIAAAVALQRSGALVLRDDVLVAEGELPDDASQLERELFEMVRDAPTISPKDALWRAAQSASADRAVIWLATAGLLRDEHAVRRLRLCVAGSVLAGLLALSLLALNMSDGRIALALLGAGAVVATIVAWWLATRGGRTTGAGRSRLKCARNERSDELRGSPPANLALAVALFGAAALWTADPTFALALDVPHEEELVVGGNVEAFLAGYDAACGGCGCGGCG